MGNLQQTGGDSKIYYLPPARQTTRPFKIADRLVGDERTTMQFFSLSRSDGRLIWDALRYVDQAATQWVNQSTATLTMIEAHKKCLSY